jgi:SET domain-containing protein
MTRIEKLSVKEGIHGKGAFVTDSFKKGKTICKLIGTLYRGNEMPEKDNKVTVRFVQIGKKTYLQISGNGDYINHSCNPNAGLVIKGTNVNLQAIKDIKQGEEITYDYSTTMDENKYELKCNCGRANCRKVIRDFKCLPNTIQQKYVSLGIVPDYILKSVIKKKNSSVVTL